MRLYEIAAQDSAIKLANEALDARAEALAPERMERIQKRRQGENKVGENEGKEKVSEKVSDCFDIEFRLEC